MLYVYIGAAVIGLALIIVGVRFIKKTMNKNLIEKLKDNYKRKNYDKAILMANQILKSDPNDFNANYFMSLAYEKKQEYPFATTYLKKILKGPMTNKPKGYTEISIRRKLIKIYLRQNMLKEANEHLKYILDRDPVDFEASYLLGKISFEKKAFDMAIKHLETAVHTNPEHFDARKVLAKAYMVTRRSSSALNTLSELAEEKPKDGEINYLMGQVNVTRSNYQEAVKCFGKAESYNYFPLKSLLKKIICYGNLNEPDKVIEETKDLFKKHQAMDIELETEFRYHIADAYTQKNNYLEAISEWEKILELKGSYKDVQYLLDKYIILKGKKYLENYFYMPDEDFKKCVKKFLYEYTLKLKETRKFDKESSHFIVHAQTDDAAAVGYTYFFWRDFSKINETDFNKIHEELISFRAQEYDIFTYAGFEDEVYKLQSLSKYKYYEKEDFLKTIKKFF